jgi:hypothetical protein
MSTPQQLSDWLNGTPTGGPNGDGRYPLVYEDGTTHLIYCPAAQALGQEDEASLPQLYAEDAEASAQAAQASATAAAASAASIGNAEQNSAASATAAATSATNAHTSETNAGNSATAAAGSAGTAAGSATAAGNSATAAAGSATTAGTQATNAAASATAASGSATNAHTSETNAATSASAASGSASAASGSATTATTQATNAAGSASAASGSATAAANSATAAAGSATAAANSVASIGSSVSDAAASASAAAQSKSDASGFATNASNSAAAAAASAASVNQANIVHIAGTESITGVKTFTAAISSMVGANGSQSSMRKVGWSDGIMRWAEVMETDASYSLYAYSAAGALLGNPLHITQAGIASFTTSGQSSTIQIHDTGANGAGFAFFGNGTTTPNKTIRAQGGKLEFINSAYSAVIGSIDDSGAITSNRTTGNPGASSTFAFNATSNFGGGYAMHDGTFDIGFWSNSGVLQIGFGTSGGAITSKVTINTAGAISASDNINAARFTSGYDSGQAQSMNCANWFRSAGNTGWYSASYGGGTYCIDTTYVRAYNNFQMAATDFVITSDRRLKAGIRPFVFRGRLKPRLFVYRRDGKADFGFIAQDVQELYPEAVGEMDGFLQLSYPKLTTILAHQINQAEDDIIEMRKQLATMQAKLDHLSTPWLIRWLKAIIKRNR